MDGTYWAKFTGSMKSYSSIPDEKVNLAGPVGIEPASNSGMWI
jgi:hypothetical protein